MCSLNKAVVWLGEYTVNELKQYQNFQSKASQITLTLENALWRMPIISQLKHVHTVIKTRSNLGCGFCQSMDYKSSS